MFAELIKKFEDLKLSSATSQEEGNAEQNLESLNSDFVLMLEEWATLSIAMT